MRAVLGRDELYADETMRMITAERVYNAKIANQDSDNWAEWARRNPHSAGLLARVEKIVNG